MNHWQLSGAVEAALDARKDERDEAEHAHEQLCEAILEGLGPTEKALIFDDAWADGMNCDELVACLRTYWRAGNAAEELLALRTIGLAILDFAQDAIGREVQRRADEAMERARFDAQRGGRYDDRH